MARTTLNKYFQKIQNRNYPDNLASTPLGGLPPIITIAPPPAATDSDLHDILQASIEKLKKSKKLDRTSYSPFVFDPDNIDSVFSMFGLNPFADGTPLFKTIDYAQAQPYIAIHFLDGFSSESRVITELDLNAKFHETTTDHARNNRENRAFADRPEVAIVDVSIRYDEGHLTGPFNDLGIAHIEYTIKFFDVSAIQLQPYRNLFALGVPMLLRFGWRNLAGKDYIEELKFQNYDYSINIDETGIATVQFRAWQQGVGAIVYAQLGAYTNKDSTGSRFTRIFEIYRKRLDREAKQKIAKDEKSLAGFRESAESSDMLDFKSFKSIFSSEEDESDTNDDLSTAYRLNIDLCIKRIDEIATTNPLNQYSFASPLMQKLQSLTRSAKTAASQSASTIKVVTLGALINEFVVRDLVESTDPMLDTVIVGNFNKRAGYFADHSMLNFPIFVDDIKAWLVDAKQTKTGITTARFFSWIMANHVANYDHYVSSTPQAFVKPQPHVFTRTISVGKKKISAMFFIDKSANIPMADLYDGLTPQQKIELQKSQVPSLAHGRSHSPIKTMNMTLINDPGLQSIIVANTLESQSSSQLQSALGAQVSYAPYKVHEPDLARLQFEGNIALLGVPHIPIYQIIAIDLKSGFWDGMYITNSIEHHLAAGEFTTDIHVRFLHLTATPVAIGVLKNDTLASEAEKIIERRKKKMAAARTPPASRERNPATWDGTREAGSLKLKYIHKIQQ